ncbi:hypothetical protein [Pseudoalteromonas piscicida]|uniref:Uncharacterized protein n=1 Tax=Pseudoalteromonas piscicida TaxID=43662 RepID=A0AAD0RLW2_PSEO7|nr:hypothetical protein [Pseudoalteromonas piscicida]ASD69182.1 hypothetical protein B1L02_19975 [Pseudoalteromonas piscicida]AXQ99792.1 hypothetical protein D0N37_19465 [Pseudoalteromonas piscicida]AXR04449.1 hypothetical protein D0511_21325 [Pseudoalteromonas piscicida]
MNSENTKTVNPAIIAAIIASATEAAKGIAESAASSVSGEPTGVFINRTQWSFSPRNNCNLPVHGHWGETPSSVKSAGPTLEKLIEDGKTPLEAALIVNASKADQESLSCVFNLKGDGIGGESLAVFDIDEDKYGDQLSVACYLKKKPGGDYYAGVSLSQGNWIGDQANGEGEELIDHIKNVHNYGCQISNGQSKTVSIGEGIHQITVIFTAGEKVYFEVGEGKGTS